MDFPDGYTPQNFCRGCGQDFTSLKAFDAHRVGSYEPDERTCRDPQDSGLKLHSTVRNVDRWGFPVSEAERARLLALRRS